MSAKSTFQKVKRFIKTESLLDRAGGVVIALSGGPDSIALLDLLVRCQKALRKNKKQPQEIKLHIAHLNHQLRGQASDDDADFVKRLAENLAIPATVEALDINKLAKKTGKGIEETAREARYKFLLNTAMKTGCDRMATGHTMNDQAETFLMRLVRGAGLRGLASMRPAIPAHRFNDESGVWSPESGVGEQQSAFRDKADSTLVEKYNPQSELAAANCQLPTEIYLIRPLLSITREEVETYCAQRKLSFRVDATNQSLNYTRNRMRHRALNMLREINPRVVEHVAQTAAMIAADQDALDELAVRFLGDAKGALPHRERNEKSSTHAVAEIARHPVGVQRRMVIAAIQQARAKFFAGSSNLSEIETAHIEAVLRLLEKEASGHYVQLPDNLAVWREFETLVFTVSDSENRALSNKEQLAGKLGEAGFHPYLINQKEQIIEVGEFRLRINRGQNRSLLKAIIEQTQAEKKQTGIDWMAVALDDALLPETLAIRTRQAGEKVFVVGQRKIKKLKNLMIDHKIASSRRATWVVVATSDGQYVWSPGLPPAIKFAANDMTERLAIIHASNL